MPVEQLHVEIEATNLCNTRCLHCPHETMTRTTGKMTWDVYQGIIDQAMAYTNDLSVEYAGMGEPLLHPEIYKFVEYASHIAGTSLTTNASALTPKNIERLVKAGLSQLTISFNGEDSQVYELMMGGLSFTCAQENLRNAIEISRGTRTSVAANVTVTRQTQCSLVELRKYLQDAGVQKIYFSKCHNRGGFLKGDVVCNTPVPPVGLNRCDILRNTLFVAWTGQVISCCHDLAGANVIGDMRTEQLFDVLEKRKQILAKGVDFPICSVCNDLYRFMISPEPGGRSIGELVYDLYAGDGQVITSPLHAWIYEIYAKEGQLPRLFAAFEERIQEQGQTIQDLTAQVHKPSEQVKEDNTRDNDYQALKQVHLQTQAQLSEILNSNAWLWVQRFQKLRLAAIPKGSHREKLFQRFMRILR